MIRLHILQVRTALRSANGYRGYALETVQLVGYIKVAQQLEFSLAEIGEHLPMLWSAPQEPVELLAERAQQVCPLALAKAGN